MKRWLLAIGLIVCLNKPLSIDRHISSKPKNNDIIKVAVIDTGFDFQSKWKKLPKDLSIPKMCGDGHKDFTKTNINDQHGHGTHVMGLIAKYAKNSNYCIVSIKYYDENASSEENFDRSIEALNYTLSIDVDIINYSGGGPMENEKEYDILKKLIRNDVKVVVSAGNDGANISKYENAYYPASYSKKISKEFKDKRTVIVVGNIKKDKKRLPSSNYGDIVNFWEIGYKVLSLLPKNSTGYMTGTSQSTAIKTGKIIKNWGQNKKTWYDKLEGK
jgi:subtilisin